MERGSYFSSFNHNRLVRLLERESFYKPRQNCSETVLRCMSFLQFCGVCAVSLVTVVTPWMLAGLEVIIMMTVYFTVVPHSLESITAASGLDENQQYHFRFDASLLDVLISSLIRVILLSIAYGLGSGRFSHRPYFAAAILTTSFLIPYVFIKAILTSLRPLLPVLMMLITSAIFSVVHVAVAHATMKRAQKRLNMGLIGFGYPWEEGEEAWVMAGRHDPVVYDDDDDFFDEDALLLDFDVPRDVLCESDSQFVDCGGISVHYKEELPSGTPDPVDQTFAVVLVHGFGGGVFAWRHLMRPLSELCGCRVVAFDRPAFGLTSRPEVREGMLNPYSLPSQRRLVIQFCEALGIKRVVMVSHADGCVLALMVAAAVRQREADRMARIASRVTSQSSKRDEPMEIGMSVRKTLSEPTDINLNPSLRSSLSDMSSIVIQDTTMPMMKPPFSPARMDMDPFGPSPGLSIAAMIFLHPDLSCEEGPSFTNLLLQSRLGRKFLRPLLRSDMGEVNNRRAWYDTSKLTHEILQLYKAPLRIQGWDSALVEVTRAKRQLTNQQINEWKKTALGSPVMVVTGEKDMIVPPEKAAGIADDLRAEHMSVLPDCGHISHEESPQMLLDLLVGFVEHISEKMEDDFL